MIIIMDRSSGKDEVNAVRNKINELVYSSTIHEELKGCSPALLAKEKDSTVLEMLKNMQGVDEVIPVLRSDMKVLRDYKKEDTVIEIDDIVIGGKKIAVMAGPCAVERRDQLLLTSFCIKEAGAGVIRGGAFRSRTHPTDFPGLGLEGLKILKEVKEETGLLVLTEVRSPVELGTVEPYADILQVGARFMQNYDLLSAVAECGKPILLKRGFMSSLEELLLSAEYILNRGNPNIILCERGIRTFDNFTPYTLDLCSIPILKQITHLPVIVDPSNGSGNSNYVPAMARAAVAAGADGLLIEVHPNPALALSHGIQALEPQQFSDLMLELKKVAKAVEREI